MKKALLLGAALMLIAGVVSAQHIGLYTDEARSSWYVEDAAAQGNIVTVYVFGNPTADGMRCIEFSSTVTGGSYMAFTPVWHPDVVEPQMGTFPDANLAACWGSCHYDYTWVLKSTLMITSPGAEMTITIGLFTGSPYPKLLTCTYVEIEAYPETHYCINYICDPINAVEESTWGAIKNLYE